MAILLYFKNKMVLENFDLKHREWHRPGMGTENVGPFLKSLISLARPQRILEIGVGYTTPFLIEGIKNNSKFIVDRTNMNHEYFQSYPQSYDPKLVIIDNNFPGDSINPKVKKTIDNCKFLEVITKDFQGLSTSLHSKYGDFDFVWFDCGAAKECTSFIKEYWQMCSEYVIFHYTYHKGSPTHTMLAILENITPPFFRLDIIEPHKDSQGSLTVIRKARVPTLKNIIR